MEAVALVFTGMIMSLAAGIFVPLITQPVNDRRMFIAVLPAVVSVLLSAMLLGMVSRFPQTLMGGRFVLDPLALLLGTTVLFVASLVLIASFEVARGRQTAASYFSIAYMALTGSILLVYTSSISLFIASWVLMSVASYVLAAIEKSRIASDAALKYAVMGGVSTLFLIMWVGSAPYLSGDVLIAGGNVFSTPLLATAAAIMLVLAAGFKVGVFPFHAWLPDVYSNVNGTIVSLFTGVVKVAAFAGFIRMVTYTLVPPGALESLVMLIALLSVVTMTYGNLAALTTRNLQRIMAYSSIAHVGYLLLGVAALAYAVRANEYNLGIIMFSTAAITVHLIAYAVSKPGVFLLASANGVGDLRSLRGLYKKDRLMAFSLTVLVMSLLGMPPLAGFWGKLYLFQAVLPVSTVLLVIAIVNSGISSFYYARIVRELYQESEPGEQVPEIPAAIRVPVAILAILTILLGLGGMTIIFNNMAIMMP